jgi:prephenate dehydratase
MKIYYQWFPGAYSYEASIKIATKLEINKKEIFWVSNFKKVFDNINLWNIWVLPIENSYAWSVHENFYHIISWDYEIIWEVFLDIEHYLLANTNDKKDIKYIYSHPQALAQCQNYIEKNKILSLEYTDTAWAAKFVKENWSKEVASISSKICSSIYNLNIIDEKIQDQAWNTTRFFIISTKDYYKKNKEKLKIKKNWKVSVTFKTKDTPSALYKCLWAFATRFINLSKIESLPSKQNRFEYIFWIDFKKNVSNDIINDALEELKFFSKDLVILGDY